VLDRITRNAIALIERERSLAAAASEGVGGL
jgi:hypothetical protein